MKTTAQARGGLCLRPLILLSFLLSIGCGSTPYSNNQQPSPPSQPPAGPSATPPMQGSWEILFHSDAAPNQYTVLEANLSQAGTSLAADGGSALLVQGEGTTPWVLLLAISRLGGKCGSGAAEQVIFDGTLTSPEAVAQSITFTLTEKGASGSAAMTASASTDGSGTLNGTYTLPAACGFPEEHGTIQGFKDSANFSATDTYSGSLQGNATVVRFASASSGSGLSASGTYNGASFALSGTTTGLSLTLTGTVSGQTVTWFGLYDSTYNSFRIYDSAANLLGNLANAP